MNAETVEFLMGMNLLQKETYSIREVIRRQFTQVHELIEEDIATKVGDNKDLKVAILALQIKLSDMLPHYLNKLEWLRDRMIAYCIPLRDWDQMIAPCPPPDEADLDVADLPKN